MVEPDLPECPRCGGLVIGLNWLTNPLPWLTIGVCSLSVYGPLAYALIRLWRS